MCFPSIALHLSSWKEMTEWWRRMAEQFRVLYRVIYHELAASLAAANQTECVFRDLRCPSWHGLACQYLDQALQVIDGRVETVPALWKKVAQEPDIKKEKRKLLHDLRRQGRKVTDAEVDAACSHDFMLVAVQADLIAKKVVASDDELRRFAVRLQQELPRAWVFKYGVGNRDYLTLDDAVVQLMESCVDPTCACYASQYAVRQVEARGTWSRENRQSLE